ncbi:hypothetical protein [Kitasatospora sp. NPDC054795]
MNYGPAGRCKKAAWAEDFGDGGEAADRGDEEGGGIADLKVDLRQPLRPGL